MTELVQPPETSPPFPGLRPYGEADRMFGREREATLIADQARAERITLVYGGRGVGKSSLLLAGVVPQLRRGAARLNRRLAVAYASSWRDDPVAVLRAALLASADVGGDARSDVPVTETLRQSELAIAGRLVIVLDQLEDYFLYHPDDRGFGDALEECVAEAGPGTTFVVSIREEAVAKLDVFADRIPGFYETRVRIDPLSRAQARDAIEGPLQETGLEIEPGFVDRVLVGLASGAADGTIDAPYLQLVMSRVWDATIASDLRVLKVETLDRLGGAERIIRGSVDDALAMFDHTSRHAVAALLRFMITPSGARIAQVASDLAYWTAYPSDVVEATLDQLVDARIVRVVPGDDVTRYELFSSVLAEPLLDWMRRWEYEKEQRETVRFFGRRMSRMRLGFAVVLSLVVLETALIVLLFLAYAAERRP